MSVLPAEKPNLQTVNGLAVRRFSVQEYHQLAEFGILGEDDRVELLEGLISPKMVHSPIHDATVSVIEYLLRALIVPGWILRIQSAITLESSEPEPDLVVTTGPPNRYASRHPQASDIVHVIEIAESSLARDRLKATTYADARIPCYWIVNLKDRTVEVYESPGNGGYQSTRSLSVDDALVVPSSYSAGSRIVVAELFAH